MIFLSHNHADKPVVEQIALQLRAALVQDQVFFDSWSIQPGEGIIDKMSEALGKCTHFFFFVSANSLKSRMVSLEWQNGLLKATKGTCRMVAVRCDQSELPPIMAQSLYIDLYGVGLEVATRQAIDVIKGESTYREPTAAFSNIVAKVRPDAQGVTIEFRAKHYLEPIPHFLIVVDNDQADANMSCPGNSMFFQGFERELPLNNGVKVKAFVFNGPRAITPTMPLQARLEPTGSKPLKVLGVMHQKATDRYDFIPMS